MEYTLQKQRILVVDDEEKIATGLRDSLEALPNCEIAVATGGEQALQLFQQCPFDLLITDYQMPGTNGITLATRIQQFYSQTTIIMVTAYTSDALHEQAARASIQCILQKPVSIAEIRRVALKVLQVRQP
jgi:CheY-like chemotaxis protein